MKRRLLLLLLVGCAGCASSAPPVPSVEQVASINLTVNQFPPDAGRDGRCAALLTKRRDLDDVFAWLNSLDWSQSGHDMAVISMPPPDGGVVIGAKDGVTFRFGFYWDGKVVHDKANRLFIGANTATLRAVALRICQ
jgi:hypothetical protein